MKKAMRRFLLVGIVSMGLMPTVFAEDEPTANLSTTVDAKLDGRKDKRNFVLYFTMLQLSKIDITLANQTRFHFEKYAEKAITKAGQTYLKPEAAAKAKTDLVLDLKVSVKYIALTMKMDGKESQTGHKWQGTVTGTLKDAAGTEIKKINIRHSWGTNMNVQRKKGASIFMSQLSNWLLLELGTTKQFRAVVPATKHAALDKTLAGYKEQKKKIYDDTWK